MTELKNAARDPSRLAPVHDDALQVDPGRADERRLAGNAPTIVVPYGPTLWADCSRPDHILASVVDSLHHDAACDTSQAVLASARAKVAMTFSTSGNVVSSRSAPGGASACGSSRRA
jgi:hypothetical protein